MNLSAVKLASRHAGTLLSRPNIVSRSISVNFIPRNMADTWDAYLERFGKEPDTVQQLMKYSKSNHTVTTLNYKQGKEVFQTHKGKGGRSGDGACTSPKQNTKKVDTDTSGKEKLQLDKSKTKQTVTAKITV